MMSHSQIALTLLASAGLLLVVTLYRGMIIGPLVRRVLRRNGIQVRVLDNATLINMKFLRLAERERRPSRRRVYGAIRRSVLLQYLAIITVSALLAIAGWIGAAPDSRSGAANSGEQSASPARAS